MKVKFAIVCFITVMMTGYLFSDNITNVVMRDMCLALASHDVVGPNDGYLIDRAASNACNRIGASRGEFLELLRNYTKDSCLACTANCDLVQQRLAENALMVLETCDATNSISTFGYVVENCDNEWVASLASKIFAATDQWSIRTYNLLNSSEFFVKDLKLKKRSVDGCLSRFIRQGGDAQATNRVIAISLWVLDGHNIPISGVDYKLLNLWSGYETSSNRYQYITAALAADPPLVNTNYFQQVKAELEALPPGTMQQLSTNFLNGAWD